MGVKSSQPAPPVAKIVLIGNGNSGKTFFLDMLTFGEYARYRPTIGTYPVLYEHDHQTLELIEYGGSTPMLRDRWHLAARASSIWLFIAPGTTSTLQLLKLCGSLMHMLALQPDRIPVCLVLQGVVPEGYHAMLSGLFSLPALDKMGWPIRIVTFNYENLVEWARVVETALDWVISKHRRP